MFYDVAENNLIYFWKILDTSEKVVNKEMNFFDYH